MSVLARSAVAVAFAIAAACGGADSATAHRGAASAWHDYVACVRTHGVPDMPDATVDEHGRADFPASAPPVPDDVLRACGAGVANLPVRSSPPPDVATLTRFARCMRAQGIADWPDPAPDGRFPLSRQVLERWKAGPEGARIEAAWRGPCAQYDPGGQLPLTP